MNDREKIEIFTIYKNNIIFMYDKQKGGGKFVSSSFNQNQYNVDFSLSLSRPDIPYYNHGNSFQNFGFDYF